jgi:hypothetical protein
MKTAVAFTSLALCVSSQACAGVTFYDIFYTTFYTQTSASPPAAPDLHVFATRVLTSDATDLASASLAVPNFPFAYNLFPVAPTSYLAARNFASQAALELAFPAGVYAHTIGGGTLGTANAALSRPANLFFCTEVPAFDASSFDTLASFPATQAVTLNFASFTRPAAANAAVTFLTIFDDQNAIVFNAAEPGETSNSITVPANTLQPGATYRATLYYSSRIETANAGFGGATAIVGCDRATNAAITTAAACPGDLNADTFVDDSDFVIFAPAYDILDCADPAMPADCPADLNADSVVDDLDFVLFAAAYNELICP